MKFKLSTGSSANLTVSKNSLTLPIFITSDSENPSFKACNFFSMISNCSFFNNPEINNCDLEKSETSSVLKISSSVLKRYKRHFKRLTIFHVP
ncbi:hypothetical protein WICPIJ_000352 [Wickerhamomyces pijperi]|uniref:Uncharacterized protein n=1 Tax=Wickerhamomyces pijperi TaxID=599730 RepID=A0A9P8QDZ3_WICPI|nr:hypothetical protein WICPIJ_000352 [Wickerhamomyces pijperi]